jgi:hypothetical protein
MMLQLNPPMPMNTPRGKGLAHIVIDYGPESGLIWVILQDDGECWSWQNKDVRAQTNITMGRQYERNST